MNEMYRTNKIKACWEKFKVRSRVPVQRPRARGHLLRTAGPAPVPGGHRHDSTPGPRLEKEEGGPLGRGVLTKVPDSVH